MAAATAVPTRAEIEAARQAWLAAACDLGGQLDECGACHYHEDCSEYARLDSTERDTWRAFERTKGGHRGYL